PYFGYAPVDVKKGINRLHAGAHGIFGCEYGVSGSFGELTDEGEIHGSVGDYLRTVAGGSRHEKRRYIWHHAGDCVSAVFCHRLDLRLGNAKMVKPFHTDLLACTLTHGLFDKVAGAVAEKTVDPADELPFGLGAELGLAVECPAQKPVGIFYGHYASGDDFPGKR